MENIETNKKIKTQSISASHRWLNCTASLLYNDKPFQETEVSLNGSMIHEVASLTLKNYFFKEKNDEKIANIKTEKYFSKDKTIFVEWKPSYQKMVDNYFEYVKSIYEKYADDESKVLIEHKLSCNFYGQQKIGYADFVLITKTNIIIVDLKTGRNKVDASENSQMLMYVIGIMQEFGARENVITAISQPIIYNVEAYIYTPEELVSWYKNQAQSMSEILSGKLVYRPEKMRCKYCDHRSECAERIKQGVV